MKDISIKAIFPAKKVPVFPHYLAPDQVKQVQAYHRSLPGYAPTPLVCLPGLARHLGIENLYVKDESPRFGLNAFKALGATWALVRILAEYLGRNPDGLGFSFFQTAEVREKIKDLVFVTATDGNHGRGLAWAAAQLGCRSHVFMPAGTARIRVENARKEGARVEVTAVNYDDTVRLAARAAQEKDWILVQDTAWEGYEKIPAWIVQGYTTMAAETLDQMEGSGMKPPTHMFLQAGVGSMAAAVLGYYAHGVRQTCPSTFILEPDQADCMYQSALADDGRPRAVTGELNTMMAGLACGEPNPQAWQILRDFATGFISCSDSVAAQGMGVLAHPKSGERSLVSGESGALGTGLLVCLMTDPCFAGLKEKMKITPESILLCFSTEGDTDPENYQRMVQGWRSETSGQ